MPTRTEDVLHGKLSRKNKTDEVMVIKKVKPMFTGIITTAKKYVGDQTTTKGGLLIDTRKMSGGINTFQTVVAIGSAVHDLKVGDVVKLNFKRYKTAKHVPGSIEEVTNTQGDDYSATYEIPVITINDVEHLWLQNNDVEYIVEEYEVDEGGLLQ